MLACSGATAESLDALARVLVRRTTWRGLANSLTTFWIPMAIPEDHGLAVLHCLQTIPCHEKRLTWLVSSHVGKLLPYAHAASSLHAASITSQQYSMHFTS